MQFVDSELSCSLPTLLICFHSRTVLGETCPWLTGLLRNQSSAPARTAGGTAVSFGNWNLRSAAIHWQNHPHPLSEEPLRPALHCCLSWAVSEPRQAWEPLAQHVPVRSPPATALGSAALHSHHRVPATMALRPPSSFQGSLSCRWQPILSASTVSAHISVCDHLWITVSVL